MKKYLLLILLFSGIAVNPAQADIAGGSYVGGGYFHQVVRGDVDGQSIADVGALDTIDFRYGFFILPILSVEAHVGMSTSRSDFFGGSAQNDYYGAAYGKINWPMRSRNLNFYVMGGAITSSYTTNSVDPLTLVSSEKTELITGVSGAFGIQMYGGENTGVSIEWYRFLYTPEFRSNGLMVSVIHNFSLWDFLFGG